jgi:hypothetical protein
MKITQQKFKNRPIYGRPKRTTSAKKDNIDNGDKNVQGGI